MAELAREANIDQIIEKLNAENAVAIKSADSMGPKLLEAAANIKAKNAYFNVSIEEFHGASISDSIVTDKHFAVSLTFDVTIKGAGKVHMEEIIVYKVEEGKIISEQFFY